MEYPHNNTKTRLDLQTHNTDLAIHGGPLPVQSMGLEQGQARNLQIVRVTADQNLN